MGHWYRWYLDLVPDSGYLELGAGSAGQAAERSCPSGLMSSACKEGSRLPKAGWQYVRCDNCPAALWVAPGVDLTGVEAPACRRKAAAN
jgi:hypothetical protein